MRNGNYLFFVVLCLFLVGCEETSKTNLVEDIQWIPQKYYAVIDFNNSMAESALIQIKHYGEERYSRREEKGLVRIIVELGSELPIDGNLKLGVKYGEQEEVLIELKLWDCDYLTKLGLDVQDYKIYHASYSFIYGNGEQRKLAGPGMACARQIMPSLEQKKESFGQTLFINFPLVPLKISADKQELNFTEIPMWNDTAQGQILITCDKSKSIQECNSIFSLESNGIKTNQESLNLNFCVSYGGEPGVNKEDATFIERWFEYDPENNVLKWTGQTACYYKDGSSASIQP